MSVPDWLNISFSGSPRPRVSALTLPIPHLPRALNGLRVAFIADLHVNRLFSDDALTALIDCIASQRPDLVLWGGDYAESPADAARFARAAARLTPPLGMLGVPGNNDWEQFGADYAGLRALFDTVGIRLLVNQAHALRVGDAVLNIIGTDDRKYGHPNGAALRTAFAQREMRVLLTHNPCALDGLLSGVGQLPRLTLCGHTHAGQVSALGITPYHLGYEHRRGRHFFRVRGVHCIDGMQLVVTGGVGASAIPLRIGAPSEFHLLTLAQKN